jgi:uncharacterized membrane protein
VKGENMENEKMLTFEINIKLGIKDYRIRYLTKKGWILALIIAVIKLSMCHFNWPLK